jgi:uncharacterized flavoprotein (TIGR03862 family)
VIGAGPAGLMAAERLAQAGAAVVVHDRMPSVARKLLMAGRGGLNLTHSEPMDAFLARYGGAQDRLRPPIEAFTPQMLRDWSEVLRQPTFVGTSGRVFPQGMKASPLLRAWLRRLDASGVQLKLRHRWQGWRDEALLFETPDGDVSIQADAVVLALGGASWPGLGATGAWANVLTQQGIALAPFKPANSGFIVAWSDVFRDRFAGQPLKGIALTFADRTVRGEGMISADGIEGGAIYALSAALRDAVMREGAALLSIALRPDLQQAALVAKLAKPRGKQSMATWLRKALNLSPVAIGLLQEASMANSKPIASLSPQQLASFINEVPVTLSGVAPIARAISTAGGVLFDAIDDRFMLRDLPDVFICGEMLDWEAPTGGYLLNASMASGRLAAAGVARWLSTWADQRPVALRTSPAQRS